MRKTPEVVRGCGIPADKQFTILRTGKVSCRNCLETSKCMFRFLTVALANSFLQIDKKWLELINVFNKVLHYFLSLSFLLFSFKNAFLWLNLFLSAIFFFTENENINGFFLTFKDRKEKDTVHYLSNITEIGSSKKNEQTNKCEKQKWREMGEETRYEWIKREF